MKYIVRTTGERDIGYLQDAIPELIVTTEGSDAMEGFVSALRLAGDSPTVHLEDDLVLCRDFKNRLEAIVAEHPSEVVQLFSMRKDDLTEGTRRIPGRRFCMGQCFYLPRGMSRDILSYYEAGWKRIQEHPTGLDLMVADYLGDNRISYLNIVPNLVDHQPVKSLINPHRSTKRQSLTFKEN